jgi:hypothetical protein
VGNGNNNNAHAVIDTILALNDIKQMSYEEAMAIANTKKSYDDFLNIEKRNSMIKSFGKGALGGFGAGKLLNQNPMGLLLSLLGGGGVGIMNTKVDPNIAREKYMEYAKQENINPKTGFPLEYMP